MTYILRFWVLVPVSWLLAWNFCQAQTVGWAKSYGGTKKDKGRDVAVDGAGNVYMAGIFTDQATFGNITLNAVGLGTDEDIFVMKTDPDGIPIWAHSFGNGIDKHTDFPFGFHANVNGYAAITGDFKNHLNFDNGTYLEGFGEFDMFLALYDADGNLLWAKVGGGVGVDVGTGVFVSDDNYVYCTGNFVGDCNFYGDTSLTWGIPPQHYIYVAKYDLAGNLLWLQTYASETNFEARSVVGDNKTFVYVGGNFSNNVTFGNATLSSLGAEDAWLMQCGAAGGNIQWVKSFGSSHPNSNECIYSIACDTSQNVYVTSVFKNDISFDGNMVVTGADQNISVAAFDMMGNYKWSNVVTGGVGGKFSTFCLGLMAEGNVVLAGCFAGEITVGGLFTITPYGPNPVYADAFYASFKPKTGVAAFAIHVGGDDVDAGHGLAGNGSGYSFACGHFKLTATFGVYSLTSAGHADAYLLKIQQNFVEAPVPAGGNDLTFFPQPAHEYIDVLVPRSAEVLTLVDGAGRVVFKENVRGLNQIQLSLRSLPAGLYFMTIEGENQVSKAKVAVQH